MLRDRCCTADAYVAHLLRDRSAAAPRAGHASRCVMVGHALLYAALGARRSPRPHTMIGRLPQKLFRCWLAAAPCACRTMEHDDRAPHAQAVAPLDGWKPHWLRAAVLLSWHDDARGSASRLARRCARPCVALGATSCAAAASFFVVADIVMADFF
ncbi:alpha-mannosidase 2 [Dorcoceras hygrometricum]|uniref:Alpha-mannosidase 2 n=1 Tax=Dorcoceras hygrometricum TaxID=472368 RepID=A0A2Z7CYS5_9LAMI|nr:alpha-mannosidase 2 [Dorcoceras hygrometricum]